MWIGERWALNAVENKSTVEWGIWNIIEITNNICADLVRYITIYQSNGFTFGNSNSPHETIWKWNEHDCWNSWARNGLRSLFIWLESQQQQQQKITTRDFSFELEKQFKFLCVCVRFLFAISLIPLKCISISNFKRLNKFAPLKRNFAFNSMFMSKSIWKRQRKYPALNTLTKEQQCIQLN